MNLKYTILAFLLCSSLGYSQKRTEKKADEKFERYEYVDAIDDYEKLIDLGYSSEAIYSKLANSNYLNARYQDAATWYEKLIDLKGEHIEPEELYKYALSLKSLKKYKESDAWMHKFKTRMQLDSRAVLFTKNKDYLKEIEKYSGRYRIKNTEINSASSEFSPAFYGDRLVFSSARDSGIVSKAVHLWNNQAFLNLYEAQVDTNGTTYNAKKLDRSLNKKTHESSAVFTKDGNTMYFTRNNSENGRFERDKNGVSRLKLFKASKVNGQWTEITELPFNHDEYSVAHPALSPDETKLYFASDMPGTHGLSDLFVVDIHADGSFGTPVNLGNKINTEARETFPFVSQENVLYFASDGHPGLGGLDIFATQLNEQLPHARVINVGKPVNSEQDDFSFIYDEDTKRGFFASNRDGGKGHDDIYGFVETKKLKLNCNHLIRGTVINDKTGATLPEARLLIKDHNDSLIAKTTADKKGNFKIEDICIDNTYTVYAEKTDFTSRQTSFTINAQKENDGILVELTPEKKPAPIGTDLAKYLDLEPIYFDLDKHFIRIDAQITMQKVIAYLKEYPDVAIEVRSHTDARASEAYNQSLSERRAKATVEYLIDQGIQEDRLSGLGFGESQLTNDCHSAKKCSEKEHQENRRSEFIVIRN
ncbi:OmpA family protein [Zobellia uliginosa]|uniref:OmpA family protein n=1 Tax=Zobellia uliginosa TaxID=143224 RepID=UPI0026E1B2C3|nr:OmpA family protein [Zobellia uliginosa]MDO6519857.1 OmpA family protein [Zobellia uliginosa]